MLSNVWKKIKKFFKDSETIFWARVNQLAGVIIAVYNSIDITSLTTIDWSTVGKNQFFWIGFGLLINGIITEVARRRRATDL